MLGDISLVDAVGKGSVQIVKNHPDWPRPYNGITAIRHGDIDRDIGTYRIPYCTALYCSFFGWWMMMVVPSDTLTLTRTVPLR
jgi:hypothetical protein